MVMMANFVLYVIYHIFFKKLKNILIVIAFNEHMYMHM